MVLLLGWCLVSLWVAFRVPSHAKETTECKGEGSILYVPALYMLSDLGNGTRAVNFWRETLCLGLGTTSAKNSSECNPVAQLEALPASKGWPVQILYPPLRGVLARLILIDSGKFPQH